MNWTEHTAETSSVNWNLVQKTTFISTSWDQTIKVIKFNKLYEILLYLSIVMGSSCTTLL